MAYDRIGAAKLWLADRAAPIGFVAAALLAVGLMLLMMPMRRAEAQHGPITAFGVRETDTGTQTLAVVQLPKGAVTLVLPPGHDCRIGDSIAVSQRRHLVGVTSVADQRGCR